MVCEQCAAKEKETQPAWKTTGSNGGKMGGNKLLAKSKLTVAPYSKGSVYGGKCKTCKAQLHKPGIYCHTCAYTSGVCSTCGKKVLDTAMYQQSME